MKASKQMYNIRILADIDREGVHLTRGQCLKAHLYGNGQARLFSYPRVVLSQREWEIVVSESDFQKLLNQ